MLSPMTKTITPSTINNTPIIIAIKTGCDAANTESAIVKIPKIKEIIERIVYVLPSKYIIPSNPYNIIRNPTMQNWNDTRNDKAFKKNINIIPNINEINPTIMDKYVKIRVSVKTKPMQNVDIPKHTKAKPITIEMNADENIG